ncbi:MAG TPA: divalent-cation tolerance protein CutA [Caldithrix abyssi]|uniref:Divalent-cation tolerance protein CutA n=1 Tax=Caldithrix abyssi TaxID=187145 RepID=A0A7V1PU45_CALAY|nr:divalent-cation tolerance protein CutA [Caldithrix abyssi]
MKNLIQVFCTLPDEASAEELARAILDERLAACCSITRNVQSYYRWQGKVEKSSEWLMLIKTTEERYKELEAFILLKHPYEVPEIIAHKIIHVSDAYAQWIESNVREI